MRIVHVTHRTWPVVGGSEHYVHEIARRQVLKGHHVTVVATNAEALSALWTARGRKLPAEVASEQDGVNIVRLPLRSLPLGEVAFPLLRRVAWLAGYLSPHLAMPLARFSPWVPKLATYLHRIQADLFFAWNLTLEGLTAAVALEAERQGRPWLAVPLLHLARSRFYTMSHQMALLQRAARVLVQTEGEGAFLQEHALSAERLSVVSPGINGSAGERAEGAHFRERHGVDLPVVVTLGTLGYDKGTLHLIQAARKLWSADLSFVLVLAGTATARVKRAVNRLPRAWRERCLLLGRISEDEKWDLIDAATALALPSRTESFGIVFLEAWTRGKPVVGARAGAVPDIVKDGVDGLLVDFGDVEGLAQALRVLLTEPTKASMLGERGKEKVLRQYTWEVQYERLRTVVAEVMREALL